MVVRTASPRPVGVLALLVLAAVAVMVRGDDAAVAARVRNVREVTVSVNVRELVFSAGELDLDHHTPPATSSAAPVVPGASSFQSEHFRVAILKAVTPSPVWLYRPHAAPPSEDGAAAASDSAAHEGLDRSDVYPEELQDTAYGLTRLSCGNGGAVYESMPSRRPETHGWLVPLDSQRHEQPLYELLASVYGRDGLQPEAAPTANPAKASAAAAAATAVGGGLAELHYALLLWSRDSNGHEYRPAGSILSLADEWATTTTKRTANGDAANATTQAVSATETMHALDDWIATHCALEFVSYAEQALHGMQPAGAYVATAPHRQPLAPHHHAREHRALLTTALSGSVAIASLGTSAAASAAAAAAAQASSGTAASPSPTVGIPASAGLLATGAALALDDLHAASERLDGGLNAVSGYMYTRYGSEKRYRRSCQAPRTVDPNNPDPEDNDDSDDGDLHGAGDHSSAAERSRIGQGLAFATVDEAYFELVPLVKPILNGLLPPVKDLMVDTLGSVLGFFMGRGMGGTIEMGLTDLIPKHLFKKLEGPIGHRLPPGIAEAVVDLVPPLVSTATRDYVVKHLTPKITEALTVKLDKALSQSIPFKVENPYTADLTRQLSLDLGHMLSKALPHTLTASLVHSLTHSPLTDYYCYYCHAEQRYCEYCTYEPKQSYYALYYAGYYSSYYADYYSRYYADVAKRRNDRRRSDDIQYLSANEHYEIVLDPSAEDSKLMS